MKVDLVGTATIFSNVSATLTQKAMGLTLIGLGNISGTGNGLANVITGNSGANTLDGLAGADRLFGNGGADTLSGGGGKDKLQGGTGGDTLSGNAGADIFIFKTLAEISGDRITDFVAGTEKIDLSGIDAVAGGADNAFAFGGQAFAGAGSVRFVQGSGETSVEIDMTGNGVADYVLKLTGLHTLAATDFIL